jgi:lysozyme
MKYLTVTLILTMFITCSFKNAYVSEDTKVALNDLIQSAGKDSPESLIHKLYDYTAKEQKVWTNNAYANQISNTFNVSHETMAHVLIELMDREGFRARPYKCPAGVWTIGFGHTGNKKLIKEYRNNSNLELSLGQAINLLMNDLESKLKQVKAKKKFKKLTPEQQLAIAMFGHNVGVSKIRRGTQIYKEITRRKIKPKRLMKKWKAWAKYKSKKTGKMVTSTNLLGARELEANLFLGNTKEIEKITEKSAKNLSKKLKKRISKN